MRQKKLGGNQRFANVQQLNHRDTEAIEGKFTLVDDFQHSGILWAPRIDGAVTSAIAHHGFASLFDAAKQRDGAAGCRQRMKVAFVGPA